MTSPSGDEHERARPARIVRYKRAARWFHAATYLLVLTLLFTGWWLLSGHEGKPSVLASWFGIGDVDLHKRAGWALVVLAGIGITIGGRAAFTFVKETFRVDRGDFRWFRQLPRGVLTGRFARHEGHFDPAQRVLNVAFVATLLTLVITGIGLVTVPGGSTFATLDRVHRDATTLLVVLVVLHVVVAVGVLPGYRGVWRSMHVGGRVATRTAARLWPAATERGIDRPATPPLDATAGRRSDRRAPVR